MKKTILAILFASFTCLTYAQKSNYQNLITQISESKIRSFEGFQKLKSSKMGNNYDLFYHRMNWVVDPAINYIQGSVESRFKAVTNMTTAQFELIDALIVDSVKYHHISTTFTHSGGLITVNFPITISANALDSLIIFYHGNPSAGSGFGSFIVDQHNGTPVMWTLSEPYGAPEWWPCKNSLSDKIDSMDIFVKTPGQYKVSSNGLLKSEVTQGSNKIYHWKHKYPIATYLIAIAITNYSVFTNTVQLHAGPLQIYNYAYPENLTTAQSDAPNVLPVMKLYDSLFFDYPYMNEKYGQTQFNWGGGMEHQTNTFLNNYGYDLMAHELAHQWFGDKVTCKSWADIWINESFATYLNGIIYDFLHTPADFTQWKTDAVNYITSQPDGSVYCTDTTSVNRIFDGRLSYNKGAMVLHMLRKKIGDNAFFTGLKNFITDNQLAYGFAGTAHFKAHMETVSGANLTDYFNDWIYGEGYPIYTIHSIIKADSSVTVSISQTQSHTSVSFFELGVPIKFKYGTKDTTIVFYNTTNNENFNAQLNFVPNQVIFDPNSDLIAKLNSLTTDIDAVCDFEGIKIFPNPVEKEVTILLSEKTESSIQIMDMHSKILISKNYSGKSELIKINCESLKSGEYFIIIADKNNKRVSKFVKL